MEVSFQSTMDSRSILLIGLFCCFTMLHFPTVVQSTPALTPTSGKHIAFPCRGLHIKGKTVAEEADPSCGVWKKLHYDRQWCGINEAMCDCPTRESYKFTIACAPRDMMCCRRELTFRYGVKVHCIATITTGRWFRKTVTIKAHLCTPKNSYYMYPWLALISG